MLHLLSLNGKNQVSFLLGVKYNFFFMIHFSKPVNNLLLDLNEWQQLPLTAKGRESDSKLAFPLYATRSLVEKNDVVLIT